MLKMKNLFLTACVMLLLVGCAVREAEVNFDKNMDVDTSHYKTFAWLTEGKMMAPPVDVNPVMKVKLDKAIAEAFIAKGYTLIEDAEKADFAISYTIGNREKIKVNSFPVTYHSGFVWGQAYYGAGHSGISIGTETQVRQYTEGKLAIDVYDVKLHQPAWHGWGVKRITKDDRKTPNQSVKAIVDKVVAQFN